MSKIFDENSVTDTARGLWRRFAESATGWLNKYRFDPFFRTEVNIVLLQAVFAAVIIGIVVVAFSAIHENISTAIVQGINTGVATGTPTSFGSAIADEIQQLRSNNLGVIVSMIIFVAIIFGYLIARVTLAPTRNALGAQKQFIGNIAHELRTPLSIIKTNTEVALLGNDMSAVMKQTLQSNVEELDRISEIINNLLSLSALVRPEQMEFTSIDLSALVSSVVEKFSHLAKHGEYQVTVRKSSGTAVWGNATALEQIVGNLLKNALTYTPRDGKIVITVAPTTANYVELIIQDSGIGISRKDLFRIFEPFYRSEQSRNRVHGGSGLGLAIVQELIKMHNGKIMIRSAVGRGTSAIVLLPAATRKNVPVGGKEQQEGPGEIVVDFSASKRT